MVLERCPQAVEPRVGRKRSKHYALRIAHIHQRHLQRFPGGDDRHLP